MPSLSKLDNEFKVKFNSIAKEIFIEFLVTIIPSIKSCEMFDKTLLLYNS